MNQKIYFGGCPTYPNSDDSQNKRFTGYFYRIAISDVKLEPEDYVLDNLVDPEAKRTLAYWNFANLDGLTASGVRRINGALSFDGTASAATTNLTLSALTQATIECFVYFGETPSSGTVLSLGSGAGSFAIASDATAGTLAGTFIPYEHLAASNGGAAALAPLAGKGAWHHVAIVIDRTKPGADAVRFYVDYERAMPAGRAWDKAAAMLDGTVAVGSGFTGRIDDLRVSAGALDPSEFIPAAARTEVPGGTCLIVR
ncbi:MAG: LamG domain-containing protein [Kiritimatiellae bacterium]|nr:LamG domain-containing protein [Kiritimatiellia bacterium]